MLLDDAMLRNASFIKKKKKGLISSDCREKLKRHKPNGPKTYTANKKETKQQPLKSSNLMSSFLDSFHNIYNVGMRITPRWELKEIKTVYSSPTLLPQWP